MTALLQIPVAVHGLDGDGAWGLLVGLDRRQECAP